MDISSIFVCFLRAFNEKCFQKLSILLFFIQLNEWKFIEFLDLQLYVLKGASVFFTISSDTRPDWRYDKARR